MTGLASTASRAAAVQYLPPSSYGRPFGRHRFSGVAIAFGLTVPTGVYAFGTISGGHFNPAVTLGAAARRVERKALPAYWIVQVIGGLVGGLVVYGVAKGKPGFTATGNMAASGFGQHSPGEYSLWAVLITEVILTGMFLLVILGATDDRALKGFAGLAIGLALTLIHMISIPISNTSVNPVRSTGVAFFNGDGAPAQLWAFWLAPLVGAAIDLAEQIRPGLWDALPDTRATMRIADQYNSPTRNTNRFSGPCSKTTSR
jgi:aquaporin Z